MTEATPLVQLRHDVKSVNVVVGRYERYLLQPIPLTRPASGQREESVTCGACGEAVLLRVRDAGSVRRRRLWWGALAVLGVALLAPTLTQPYGVAVRLLGIVSALVAWGALIMLWEEDGVRMVSRSPGHALKFGRGQPQPPHQFGLRVALVTAVGLVLLAGGVALCWVNVFVQPVNVAGTVFGAVVAVLGIVIVERSVAGVRAYRSGRRLPWLYRYKGD